MFGYVMVNKPELKVKDYEKYHGYYCGLCRRLKKRHPRTGQSQGPQLARTCQRQRRAGRLAVAWMPSRPTTQNCATIQT